MVHLENFKFFSMDGVQGGSGSKKKKSWRDKEDQIALSHSVEPKLYCVQKKNIWHLTVLIRGLV